DRRWGGCDASFWKSDETRLSRSAAGRDFAKQSQCGKPGCLWRDDETNPIPDRRWGGCDASFWKSDETRPSRSATGGRLRNKANAYILAVSGEMTTLPHSRRRWGGCDASFWKSGETRPSRLAAGRILRNKANSGTWLPRGDMTKRTWFLTATGRV